MYTIPSFDPSSEKRDVTAIPTNLRDSLSCLDVVWSDMFETGDSANDPEAAMADFLKGAPAQWLHFNTSEISPFVERDGFGKLIQLIEREKGKSCLITEVSLQYEPGSGGSTLAMQVLWHFCKDLRCARVIDLDAKKLPKQVVDLFLLSNQKTVLLLIDTKENTNIDQPIKNTLWENLIDEIQTREIKTDTPAVIILNCRTANFPTKDSVEIKMKLSTTEKTRFDEKRHELEEKFKEKSQNFHAFNIMQGGFKQEDAEKVITAEMVEHVKNNPKSKSTRLLSFLALINSYVPGSHLSRLSCEEFIAKTDRSSDEENTPLQTTMKPFMDLIVVFSEGKPEKTDYIRMAHPMIADACVNMLTEHNLTRFNIASDFLNSMVKGKESNYMQICKRMLTDRLDTEKNRFSKLILDFLKDGRKKQCIDLLELASDLFKDDPFYPQALARLYYIEVKEANKFDEAEHWANIAIKRDKKKNSYIRDTLGQVHKSHLRTKKPWTDTETVLNIAKSAIKAFKDEEEAAEVESEDSTSFNNRGYFGFLQVCKGVYDLAKKPLEQKISEFISEYKGDVEDRYDFFEWYLAFSRPKINKKDPDYLHNDIVECYKRYFKKEKQTDEATLNEKKMKSFGGLLHFLKSDASVFKQTFKNPQSDDETQNILYVLANIILSMSDGPSERVEELQASLHKLWVSKKQGRSPEFYLLILLLFWFDEAQPRIPNPPDLEDCVKYMAESYEKKYQKYLRGRYLVPLFFLRKESGLVHISKLHQNDDVGSLELLKEGDEVSCLQRISGEVKKDLKVFAIRDGKQIQVIPHKPASVCKQGKVSFYLGFNIRGPVAFNIRY
ncbi:sterile alpha motif domain-containing protein 9-like [Chanodichthys erythropterus]|uniref:sterile alpha motif domain-containing protein 9-like n=1 Tax=Chanodichthys erythropterus TaxID=933992 RepID=UPI00351ECA64